MHIVHLMPRHCTRLHCKIITAFAFKWVTVHVAVSHVAVSITLYPYKRMLHQMTLSLTATWEMAMWDTATCKVRFKC